MMTEERLPKQEMLSLDKIRFKGDMATVFKYLKLFH